MVHYCKDNLKISTCVGWKKITGGCRLVVIAISRIKRVNTGIIMLKLSLQTVIIMDT